MLLTIDIGNTEIFLGLFENKELLLHYRLHTDPLKTSDEYGVQILQLLANGKVRAKEINNLALSCVVPPLLHTFLRMSEEFFRARPLVVGPGMNTGVEVRMANPMELGADRLVNAAAVHLLYSGSSIVVDFGTATTFDVITARGEYLGGAIAPGLGTSLHALTKNASMLPKVEVVKPGKAIGDGTIPALQSGIFYGYVGLVEKLVREITEELEEKPQVIATGGLAYLIAGGTPVIDEVNPFLTLEGLRIIFEKNR